MTDFKIEDLLKKKKTWGQLARFITKVEGIFKSEQKWEKLLLRYIGYYDPVDEGEYLSEISRYNPDKNAGKRCPS